ncbi:unnamed protein product, partial [Symbiodinium microadriaticum]
MPAGTGDIDTPFPSGKARLAGGAAALGHPAAAAAPSSASSPAVASEETPPSADVDADDWVGLHCDPATALQGVRPGVAPWLPLPPRGGHITASGSAGVLSRRRGAPSVSYRPFAERALRCLEAPAAPAQPQPPPGSPAGGASPAMRPGADHGPDRLTAFAALLRQSGHSVWAAAFLIGSGADGALRASQLALRDEEAREAATALDVASRLGRRLEEEDYRAADEESGAAAGAVRASTLAAGRPSSPQAWTVGTRGVEGWAAVPGEAGAQTHQEEAAPAPLAAVAALTEARELGADEDAWAWGGADCKLAESTVLFCAGLDWSTGVCLAAGESAQGAGGSGHAGSPRPAPA